MNFKEFKDLINIVCDNAKKSVSLGVFSQRIRKKINELGERNDDLQITAVINDKEEKAYSIKEVRQFSVVPDVSIVIMEENNDP